MNHLQKVAKKVYEQQILSTQKISSWEVTFHLLDTVSKLKKNVQNSVIHLEILMTNETIGTLISRKSNTEKPI